jgi:hypothetical protein
MRLANDYYCVLLYDPFHVNLIIVVSAPKRVDLMQARPRGLPIASF